MHVVDTNVISELMRPVPNGSVAQWIHAQPIEELAITAVTVAEILYGLDLMADGRRKADLRTRFTAVLERAVPDRVLPFDEAAAAAYARIRGDRDRGGRPISVNDAMIAAIARIHGAAVVTRNVTDFAHSAIGVLNPWREADAP